MLKEGHTIVINSSYRDYNSQKEIWESRKDLYGTRKADEYAARPGYSEHQTGYAIDVSDYYDVNDEFGKTDSFLWMKENCYKYGFILRYPEDKEDITGYSYEPWHYRYVGKDAALKIKMKILHMMNTSLIILKMLEVIDQKIKKCPGLTKLLLIQSL